MSIDASPSTIAWWILVTIANRSSHQPFDQVDLPQRPGPVELARHAGGRPARAAARPSQARAARSGGRGSPARRPGRRPTPAARDGRAPRGSSAGTAGRRPAARPISATKRSGSKPGVASKVIRPPTCIAVVGSSMKRNDASRGESRSAITTSPVRIFPPTVARPRPGTGDQRPRPRRAGRRPRGRPPDGCAGTRRARRLDVPLGLGAAPGPRGRGGARGHRAAVELVPGHPGARRVQG